MADKENIQALFIHTEFDNEYYLRVESRYEIEEVQKALADESITADEREKYNKMINRHLAGLLACQYVTKRLDAVGRQIIQEIQKIPSEKIRFKDANDIMEQIAKVILSKKNNPEFVYFDYDKYRETCKRVSNYLMNITEIIKNDSNSLAELSKKLDNDCYVCPINMATSSASTKPSDKLSTIEPASVRRHRNEHMVSLKICSHKKCKKAYSYDIIDSIYFARFRTYNLETHAIDDIAKTYFSANDKENIQALFIHTKFDNEYYLRVESRYEIEEVQKALADESITADEREKYNKMINWHLAGLLACQYVTKRLDAVGRQIIQEIQKIPSEKIRFKDANYIREQIAKVIQDKKNNPEFVYFDYDKYRETCRRVSNYLMNITEIIKNDSNSLAELSIKLDSYCYVCPINY